MTSPTNSERIQRIDDVIQSNTEGPADGPNLDISQDGHVLVFSFRRRKLLDESTIQQTGHEMFESIASHPNTHVVVDLAGVEFLSSSMLGKLITVHKKLLAKGRLMAFSSMNPEIYEVFEITKLKLLFEFFETADEAIRSLNSQPAPVSS